MKYFYRFSLTLCLLFGISTSAVAFNSFEQVAQKQMNEYLKNGNYETRIIKDDNSINFMVGENIYWLTFDGDATGILFTLHRRPIRLGEKDTPIDEMNRRRENAVHAIGSINASKPYKAYLKGNQVEFEFPVYAISATEYQKIFPKVLKSLKEINMNEFKMEMNVAGLATDSIHNFWANYTPDKLVIKQPLSSSKNTGKVNKGRVVMSNPMVRSVDMRGNVLIPYGEVIYQDKMQFMQPCVNVITDKPDIYNVGIKVINPEGKTLVPYKDEDMTFILPVEIGKKEKMVEFGTFGSSNYHVWTPGKYTIVFYVEGEEVARQSVNIL